jgi:ABC-type uncharacterized transport system substrate-binding protein
MTARRRFIASSALALSSALAPLLARAQAPARNVTIGILNFGDAPKAGAPPEPITVALRGLGYVEGRNVRYIRRYAGGKRDAYAMLAAAILREPVDVVYTPGSDIAQAFKAAGRACRSCSRRATTPWRAGSCRRSRVPAACSPA